MSWLAQVDIGLRAVAMALGLAWRCSAYGGPCLIKSMEFLPSGLITCSFWIVQQATIATRIQQMKHGLAPMQPRKHTKISLAPTHPTAPPWPGPSSLARGAGGRRRAEPCNRRRTQIA